MTEQDAAAIRRKTARLLAAVLLGLALLAFGCFWFWCSLFGWPAALRHGNPNLSPQAAAEQLESAKHSASRRAESRKRWCRSFISLPPENGGATGLTSLPA